MVIFFDFNALGGPGFRAGHCASIRALEFPHPEPPKTKVFSKDSGGFWQVEGSPPLVGASGAPKINIFFPRSTKNQYFLSLEHQKSIFSVPGAPKINIFYPGAPKINIFCPRSTKNQYFLSPEHEKSIFSIPRAPQFNIFTPHSINK